LGVPILRAVIASQYDVDLLAVANAISWFPGPASTGDVRPSVARCCQNSALTAGWAAWFGCLSKIAVEKMKQRLEAFDRARRA